MPSAEQLTLDTLPDGQAQIVDPITDGNSPAQDTEPAKLILGKYKTEEEAAKGIDELQKLSGKQAEELGKLRAEAESLRQRAEMKDLLTAVVNNAKPQSQIPVFDKKSFIDGLKDKWLDKPEEAADQILGLSSRWVGESEKRTISELETMKQQMAKMQLAMEEKMERMTPEYQQHKETIETMVKKGVSLSIAREIVKELAGNSSSSAEPVVRNRPPSSLTPTRTTAVDNKTPSEYMFDPRKDLNILAREFPDKNEQELIEIAKQMNERRMSRMNNGEPAVQKSFKNMTRRSE